MPHILFSELKNWNFCPNYHKLTYIDKLKAFLGNEYTAFGTAIHTICERKLLGKTDHSYDSFKSEFIKEISSLPEEVELQPDLVIQMGPQAEAIIPEIMPALESYFPDGYEVLNTEEMLMEPIADQDYSFKGYIDAVLKTPDGKIHIIDWKSCSWGWDTKRRSDPMVTYQLTLYKIFYAQKHNIELDSIETHFALLKRTAKANKVEIFRVTSGSRKRENAISLLNKALFNIKKKNFIKDKRSCAKCEFYKTKHCP